MSRYLKLVNFEFNRFFKLYLVLIGMTILLQIMGVIVVSRKYLNVANELIYKELMLKSEFIEQLWHNVLFKYFRQFGLWDQLCFVVLY